jgi:lysozyme family protein
MADFLKIITWILYQEDDKRIPGKIVDLGDNAGLTRLGLTQRWHASDLPITFFSTLPFKDAVQAAKVPYRKQYWDLLDGDLINSDIVAAPLMSFAVNDTVRVAVKTLQSVLEVVEDGQIGPATLAELNSKDPIAVARLYRAEWASFYHRDVSLNPTKAQFLTGWLNRVDFPYPSSLVTSIYS